MQIDRGEVGDIKGICVMKRVGSKSAIEVACVTVIQLNERLQRVY